MNRNKNIFKTKLGCYAIVFVAVFILGSLNVINFSRLASASGPTTWTSEDSQKSITDLHWTCSYIDIYSNGYITDLNCKIINITHTYDADLDIYLINPGASNNISLSTDNGGSGDNYRNTIFDDEASTYIYSGTAPFTNSYKPESVLSVLDSKDIYGRWKLSIYDDNSGYTGTLAASGWSLTIEYQVAPEPTVPDAKEQFDNSLVPTTTPTIKWEVPEDEDSDPLHFYIQIDDDITFGSLEVDKNSYYNSTGFGGSPDDTPPYPEGTGTAWYNVQSADNLQNGMTYWWHVRAYDGAYYGPWSIVRSFTIDTTQPITAWQQTTKDQFDLDSRERVVGRGSPNNDAVVYIESPTGALPIQSYCANA